MDGFILLPARYRLPPDRAKKTISISYIDYCEIISVDSFENKIVDALEFQTISDFSGSLRGSQS